MSPFTTAHEIKAMIVICFTILRIPWLASQKPVYKASVF
jgi:hypothetical protein